MTFIVAEAGVNHNGSLEQAFKLADAAKAAGADAVKFQLFDAVKLGREELRYLQFSREQMKVVKAWCVSIGIEFMCTPFDVDSLDYLVDIGVKRLKISSGCLRNFDILYAAYQSGLPVILSTGMSSMEEVRKALGTLHGHVTLLHCTSEYPCKVENVNLKAMDTLREFGYPVGYSDHTEGIIVAVAAAARGATVIEKHLTLDRLQDGPDHKASIEPGAFRAMVSGIRNVARAMGDGVKRLQPCELAVREMWP